MRTSNVLRKIRSGECARFAALGHYLPFFIRHGAHCGFDAIWLDLEHRAMDQREVQSILALCHQYDIDCMVRASTLERTKLYRYFEDGAAGLLMPLVDDAATARHIARSVKFPPIGNRGLDGAGLDADFGLIEDPAALASALDAIPGLVEHGLFLGSTVERAVIGSEEGIREIKHSG